MLPEVLVPAEASSRHKRSRRDWLVDGTFFAMALLIGAFLLGNVEKREDLPEALIFADLVAGLIGCVLLWWRRRWPVHIAVALALVGGFSAFSGAAGAIALFTVAVHRRFAVVVAVAAVGLATVPIYILLHPKENDPAWASVAFIVIITGG